MEYLYINSKDKSNKFWSYNPQNANEIIFKWGRLGTKTSTITKKMSLGQLRKKIDDKIKKGYVLVTKEKLNDEITIAKKLGTTKKITKIIWLEKSGNYFQPLPDYDPTQYILVELYSNGGSYEGLIFSKDVKTWEIRNYNPNGNHLISNDDLFEIGSCPNIRSILKNLSDKVQHVIKTVKFGDLGVRKINGVVNNVNKEKIMEELHDSNINDAVIEKFISLGKRKICL